MWGTTLETRLPPGPAKPCPKRTRTKGPVLPLSPCTAVGKRERPGPSISQNVTGPTQPHLQGRPMGKARFSVRPHGSNPMPEEGSTIHPGDRGVVRHPPTRRSASKRPAPEVGADGWQKMPGNPPLPSALKEEEEEAHSVHTDNRYAILSEEATAEVPTKITPQPLPQRTGQRHRTQSPMGPSGINQSGSGVRGLTAEGTSSQDARLCETQQSKIPEAQPSQSDSVQGLREDDTTAVQSTEKKSVSWKDTIAESRPDSPPASEEIIFALGATEGGCMYVPGNLGVRKVTYLIDTGCSHNLLSKSVFDRMPSGTRHQLVPLETAAAMADGSGLPIYGKITLQGRVRNMRFEEEFLVSRIADDAILGMVFLQNQECTLACDKGILTMGSETVLCTDARGTLLANKVQVLSTIVIPPKAEMQVCCRLNSVPSHSLGLVENSFTRDTGLAVAATLCVPDNRRRLLVRCINVTEEPHEVRAGTIIGLYQPVGEDQIVEQEPKIGCCRRFQGDKVPTTCPEHMKGLLDQALRTCQNDHQAMRTAQLLTSYADVFSKDDEDVGRTDLVRHTIPVVPGTTPIRQPPRRLGPEKDKEVEEQVAQLIEKGLVEPGGGAWSSPVVLVRKKDQSWRLCVDYRRLNSVTRKDAYPLPRIDDSLDALTGSAYFSTLDLLSGYWQVPLDAEAQEKAAFVTRGGLWTWKVLPFGLTSAPATFERLMEQVLKGLQWKTLLLYLDDVIVYSPDIDSHLDRLAEVLDRFRAAGLKLKPAKCELLQQQVKYLGHVVSAQGVATDPEKVEAVKDWKTPTCVSEVRAFLGFVGYYRRFIPDFATVVV